ncbi:hypothetical protein [Paenibacillus sp. UNC499MF]|uniref:hypothetical protein n=1 Tax=Paenibacillus sp. UNC499MF TaxID=1502751 RepID=UPI00089FB27E|nr:hypothetical protein [Paenibacillus sp. UNC499MF]SEF45096.1 hypothetical protein SAMN02799616_00108 [Paenibacillus sp. UNC499MF]
MSKADLPALLNYSVLTSPSPLQASTQTFSASGNITLVVTPPPGKEVYCPEIDLYIPSGALSRKDIFDPGVNTDKWQYAVGKIVEGSEVGLAVDISYIPLKFTAKSSQDYLINYPLILTVGVGSVSAALGDIRNLHILETSSSFSGDYQQRDLPFGLTIGLPEFFVRNFVAGAYDSSKPDIVPGGSFANGQAFKLSWEGNASQYQIVTTAGTAPLYSGTDNSFAVTKGLSQTTTFILIASRTDGVRGETLYVYEAVTVHITNPDETPNTVSAAGNIATAAGLNGKTLQVSGSASLNGGADVTGPLNAKGELNVTGTATMSGGTVTGPLTVQGSASLGSSSVQGALSVGGASTLSDTAIKGALSAAGSVGMLGYNQQISTGTHMAGTDGFVIGYVYLPWKQALSVGWIYGGTDGYMVQTTGGNTGGFTGNWTKYNYSNPNTFMFPVRRGASYWIGESFFKDNEVNPNTAYYFVPLGSGSSGEEATVKISDEVPEDIVLPHDGLEKANGAEQAERAKLLTRLLEEILEKPIGEDKKKALIDVLGTL